MTNMKSYRVCVREVWVQFVDVIALNKEEAKNKVVCGEGHWVDNALEYSHALDKDTWTVDEIDDVIL